MSIFWEALYLKKYCKSSQGESFVIEHLRMYKTAFLTPLRYKKPKSFYIW